LAWTNAGVKLTSPIETAREDARQELVIFIKITLLSLDPLNRTTV
jgi:hypothetical protein